MPNTYTLIASNTLGASATSVTFSAIPSTYTDLVLRLSLRGDQANYSEIILLEFNGSAAANYSYTAIRANGSTADSVRGSAQTYGRVGYANSGNSTADTFGNAEIYIPSYTASQNKPFSGIGMSENNSATAGEAWITPYATLWSNTSAITSIKISPINGPNWVSGSSFYLYGIKNS
jgi:hypothetical protein